MNLNDLLSVMDRAAANLAKLESVWVRAQPFIPTGPSLGSDQEYDDLQRAWRDLRAGLPSIDGWTITVDLPDISALGAAYLDYAEINEPAYRLAEEADQPSRDLAQYRYLLNRARRRAIRERLQQLTAFVDTALPRLVGDVPRDSRDVLEGSEISELTDAFSEIDRLVGDSAQRRGRWADLNRHVHFSQGHDWHDIHELDWPSIKPDVEAAGFADTEPLPVPDIDLGALAAGHPSGSVTTALHWDRLTDEDFERLLYDLLRSFSEHQNVQWLTHTRAPDRGRDLSMERVIRDGTGGVRTERVIVQAKHWLARSVSAPEVSATVANAKLWEPPVVRGLVIVTSGRFTTDAVDWSEKHNEGGSLPFIEMWPESKLEMLLAQRPNLAAEHNLR